MNDERIEELKTELQELTGKKVALLDEYENYVLNEKVHVLVKEDVEQAIDMWITNEKDNLTEEEYKSLVEEVCDSIDAGFSVTDELSWYVLSAIQTSNSKIAKKI